MMKPILAEAVAAVISTAKKVAGTNAASTRMAFVGGLAVTRLTKHRLTDDIDVFFVGDLEGRKVRAELSCGHSAFRPNFEAIIGLTYKSPILGQVVKVDILDMPALRFEPRTLPLSEVTLDNLPWPTRDDLISIKALSASERFDEKKVHKDVGDIEALLELQPGPLLFPGSTMAKANKAMVKELVPKLAQFGRWSETEWLERLGL
ncbi:hypothetical protein DL764_001838 [Monosporascus ibericus]|uniref:Nucleotidyl transferase AbiEii/AbiGii toxin family protein n=1 Tax=Monosporascus ibericus TaxID=155417 RepID=A0A4Q4TRB1_9PEZI|nr:hypothetical protein DL764_001838 [Monosporascus ibericus]